MGEAMRGVTKAMKQMNKKINLPAIQKIMQDFEKESEIMDMKEEMMNDTIDDAVEEEEDEEESDQIVQQVLDEIGITFEHSLPNAVTGGPVGAKAQANAKQAQPIGADDHPSQSSTGNVAADNGKDDGGDDDILQQRLNNLRK